MQNSSPLPCCSKKIAMGLSAIPCDKVFNGCNHTPSTTRDFDLHGHVKATARNTGTPWYVFCHTWGIVCIFTPVGHSLHVIVLEGVPNIQCFSEQPKGCDVSPLRPVVSLRRALISRRGLKSSLGVPHQRSMPHIAVIQLHAKRANLRELGCVCSNYSSVPSR